MTKYTPYQQLYREDGVLYEATVTKKVRNGRVFVRFSYEPVEQTAEAELDAISRALLKLP